MHLLNFYTHRYTPVDINLADIDDPRPSHLAYGIFSVNVISYVISAVIFAPGPPYRDTFFSNSKFYKLKTIYISILFFRKIFDHRVAKFYHGFLDYCGGARVSARLLQGNLIVIALGNKHFQCCFSNFSSNPCRVTFASVCLSFQ